MAVCIGRHKYFLVLDRIKEITHFKGKISYIK
jgi:hypothetical protein